MSGSVNAYNTQPASTTVLILGLSMPEGFYPTICFGFVMEKDKTVMQQMWVDQWGNTEWRPVPMIELSDKKKPEAVAGYLDGNDLEDH